MLKKLWILLTLVVAVSVANTAEGRKIATEIYRDASGKVVRYGGSVYPDGKVLIPKAYVPSASEARGVWVATVENLDFGKHQTADSFRKAYIKMLDVLQSKNINTVIFQVRPTCDAFYPSSLNPWSRYFSGTEGRSLAGFDPLRFMLNETHRRKMEFHAWLNPYRVVNSTPMTKSQYLKTLHEKNFAAMHPEYVLDIPQDGGKHQLILNPGEPEVIRFLTDTVRELVDNYDVDAIHFDDYFYPYSGVGNADHSTFNRYRDRIKNIDDWRRQNVNNLIQSVSSTIKISNRITGRKAAFGISPFGIWANYDKEKQPAGSRTRGLESYNRQYADTRFWIQKGWIDYVVPQIYWHFNHNTAAYAALVDWWTYQVRGTKVNLYIGMAPYRLGTDGAWNNPMELADQLRYNSKHAGFVKGAFFFSYRSLANPTNPVMEKGLDKVFQQYWSKPAAVPACGPRRK